MKEDKLISLETIRYICLSFIIIAGLVAIIASCGGGPGGGGGDGGGTGNLLLGLIDSATDDYKAVYVTIKEVSVHTRASGENGEEGNEKEGDKTNSWKVIAEPNQTYNLLELVNGVIEQLGVGELDAGHYTQMRLLLGEDSDGKENILKDIHPFPNYVITKNNTYQELKVPSGYQTGIKLVHGFDVESGVTVELILDFDAAKSIVKAGNSGQILLKPTIKVIDTIESQEVFGQVLYDDSGVSEVYVSAQQFDPTAADDKDRVIVRAGTLTDEEGFYSLWLMPGTYNLVAYRDYRDNGPNYLPACHLIEVKDDSGPVEQDINLEISDTSGTISGGVVITSGVTDQSVEISFRQSGYCANSADEIEIATVSVVSGVTYSQTLPEGTYWVVGSTEYNDGTHETQTYEINTGSTLDLVFP